MCLIGCFRDQNTLSVYNIIVRVPTKVCGITVYVYIHIYIYIYTGIHASTFIVRRKNKQNFDYTCFHRRSRFSTSLYDVSVNHEGNGELLRKNTRSILMYSPYSLSSIHRVCLNERSIVILLIFILKNSQLI
jgi:hypothetical protein